MNTAQKKLNLELVELKRKFESQVDAYISNLNEDLRLTLENLKDDFLDEGTNEIKVSPEDLMNTFLHGKRAFKDTLDAFFDDTIPDYEFASAYELSEAIDEINNELELHLKDDESETHTYVYNQLKSSVSRYNEGVKSEQDSIIRLLSDEFGLDLVTL